MRKPFSTYEMLVLKLPEAFVLMTALVPTIGHERLVEFATGLGPTTVLLNTQPDEPFVEERKDAIEAMCERLGASFKWYGQTIAQTPEESGDPDAFWDMWHKTLCGIGFEPGDYIVASETYGIKLAEVCEGIFMPYDPQRELRNIRATDVRADLLDNWLRILPEFRPELQKTVTIFGAESTGKTTLSRALRDVSGGASWYFEWARPYLETVGSEITDESMTAIWKGQLALQRQAEKDMRHPFIVQDTDLFSTVGYWENWKPGATPERLITDAIIHKSDLYIICKSNIPFEEDPLRYGGDKRETSDQYWIDLCEKYHLPYVVLLTPNQDGKAYKAGKYMYELFDKYSESLTDYERRGQ